MSVRSRSQSSQVAFCDVVPNCIAHQPIPRSPDTVLMTAAIAMYAAVIVPNLRLLSDPTNVSLLNRSSIRTERDSLIRASGGEPPELYTEPLSSDERISALRIIAATNTIILVFLFGIALLQGTEVWLENQEKKDAEKARNKEAEDLRQQLRSKGAEETKKSQ